MTLPSPQERAELLEALVRHAMHEHKSIDPRGFDSIKRRNKIHDEIDRLLDGWQYLNQAAKFNAGVNAALDRLDGSTATAVSLSTGLSSEELADLGGFPD